MWDAIVVGARCAGSPTAMLLAQRGYRVLLLERAAFPADTVSTHYIHQSGVAALKRWGLFDRVAAAGAPVVGPVSWDLYGVRFESPQPVPADGATEAIAPRRTVLDPILRDAAVEAGASYRERFTVKELLWEDGAVVGVRGREAGGPMVEERARIVVGADGMRSTIADLVGAERYAEQAPLTHAYYTYFAGTGVPHMHSFGRPGFGGGLFPTNDGNVVAVAAFSTRARPGGIKDDVEGNVLAAWRAVPEMWAWLERGERVAKIAGMADIPNFFRRAHGPGWVLVGDAGYFKDPLPAQGISDAFRDAQLAADALDAGLSGARPMDGSLADFARARDEHAMPAYAWTKTFAELPEADDRMRELLTAIGSDPEHANRFAGLNAETVTVDEFYSIENITRMLGARSS